MQLTLSSHVKVNFNENFPFSSGKIEFVFLMVHFCKKKIFLCIFESSPFFFPFKKKKMQLVFFCIFLHFRFWHFGIFLQFFGCNFGQEKGNSYGWKLHLRHFHAFLMQYEDLFFISLGIALFAIFFFFAFCSFFFFFASFALHFWWVKLHPP